MIRILVTGSRHWPLHQVVWDALNDAATTGRITVVHGHCPTGADLHAHQWATTMRAIRNGHTEEQHPADWNRHGLAAGPIRNQTMVNTGADLCLAFPYGKSPGTRDCMHRAKLAGIRIIDLGMHQEAPPPPTPDALW